MTTSTLDREVEERLRERDVRYTQGRRTVVIALGGSDGPMSATELHRSLGYSIPLSSLYRSLAVLEDAGVLVRHFGPSGVTRFELADWLRGHHHHLICIVCGAVEDLALPSEHEARVRQLVDEIGSTLTFTALDHALEIEGRCGKCA